MLPFLSPFLPPSFILLFFFFFFFFFCCVFPHLFARHYVVPGLLSPVPPTLPPCCHAHAPPSLPPSLPPALPSLPQCSIQALLLFYCLGQQAGLHEKGVSLVVHGGVHQA